jgi:antitoxin VapB
MAMTIRNPEVERLAAEVAMIENQTKTEAIRRALEDRLCRVRQSERRGDRRADFDKAIDRFQRHFGIVPPTPPITKVEEEEILGFGPEGH